MVLIMEIKNIWICGIGGVGGYFGGKIAYKISNLEFDGYKVYFLARGSHLEEINKNGLRLHLANGKNLICKPTLASDKIDDFPMPDLCLICVKSYDLDDLIIKIEKKLADNTVIIPLMNGIDIYDRIRKNLKKSIVLPSCVYIGSHIEEPGLIIQSGNPGFFYCGPDPKYPNFNPHTIIDFFKKMKVLAYWKENPYPAIWEKYLLVASFALISAYTGQTMGEIIYDYKSRTILEKIMEEIIMIAKRKEIKLPDNIIENTIEFCKDYPDVRPSYQRDVEKGGKTEGDLFGGAIIRMGKELGIPTPITNSIYREDNIL
jgi:2-dehydropantoate 2-reductase